MPLQNDQFHASLAFSSQWEIDEIVSVKSKDFKGPGNSGILTSYMYLSQTVSLKLNYLQYTLFKKAGARKGEVFLFGKSFFF